MKKVMDSNKMCANYAYLFSEVASIYPITPSSPMASNIDFLNGTDKKNLFNSKVELIEMQSEAGAAGALHGALITGSLATTFTASQGLLLMIPNMYKIAGEMLPCVIHVASRTVATHALSIFGDHSDIYATRGTGFCMLASTNISDVRVNTIVSHLSAIKGSLPFLHFFDGFRTSHEVSSIDDINDDEILKLIDYEKINEFKNNSLNVGHKIEKGLAENEDIYFQSMEARNKFYLEVPDIVNDYMQKVNKITNTSLKPFNYYGADDASLVIVAMGSVIDTIKLVVDEENKKGCKLGVIEVHLYRPFSEKYLLNVLPKSVEKIAVLDRVKESGSTGEPLYLDVLAALSNTSIKVYGGRYGLSSKNTTPADIYSVFEFLNKNPKHNFTIGIVDDVTNLSLKKYNYHINSNFIEIKIYGFGSDGMVSASKDILNIAANKLDKEVDGYFSYDSKKSGGVTVSNLRIKDKKTNMPFYIENPFLVVVTKDEYFRKYKMLSGIKKNGILLINTSDKDKLNEKICLEDKKIIKNNNIKVLCIDASNIALKYNIPGKINKILEVIILNLIGVANSALIIEDNIRNLFKNKGKEVIDNNKNAIKEATSSIKEIELNDIGYERNPSVTLFEKITNREGDSLTVSEVMPIASGTFIGDTSKLEKRKVSDRVIKWIPENCIECGKCVFVCPHSVIRAFATKKDSSKPLIGNDDYKYLISISEADCTGCGLCIDACPGKNGQKALEFGKFDESKQDISDYYFNEYKNPLTEKKDTVRDLSFVSPKFSFSGACAGCGESGYIKLLTQIVGDKLIIANATGCSSIYGGSAPSTPYSISWANSLFEDNAEFALGMYLSNKQKRNRIENIMKSIISVVSEDVKILFEQWLSNKEDFNITYEIKNKLEDLDIPKEIRDLIDYVPSRSIWALGGDGWAYDIGFSGIDHILSSGENIKILVLDSEVYSNTGGQMSKSSNIGEVAEFANFGKRTAKKDLFKISVCYPNCYVGSISMGANPLQAVKVLKEAEEYCGPAIVIAYSTCVEHGIKGGMSCSLKEQDLAVKCGYELLMHYNPKEDKLYLDSKEPDFSLYDDFLNNEVRYNSLKIKDKELALKLFEQNKNNAIKRYNYYKEKSTN